MPKLKSQKAPSLGRINLDGSHVFSVPSKCINDGTDVSAFLASYAHADIMTFLLQLTASMFPRRDSDGVVQVWESASSAPQYPVHVSAVRSILADLDAMIEDYPPDTGARRFGNVAFRRWFDAVENRSSQLLQQYLSDLLSPGQGSANIASAIIELRAYLMGSWGSAQRLDYGTGHELSFLAFLGCLWKLGAFKDEALTGANPGRAIVLGIFDPYLALVKRLIQTYTLEPAGSHGVWGLDDHFFLPYIFGSAQLSPVISDLFQIPSEGSLPDAPNPGDIIKETVVAQFRERNFYFGAIGFINDVKKGPFWEHSPVLYDISGVTAGWAKINKGMIKMYNAEVLSKFPVVQHFPFGSLFRWQRNPDALPSTTTPHVASHTQSRPQITPSTDAPTAAPWASSLSTSGVGPTAKSTRTGQPPVSMSEAHATRARDVDVDQAGKHENAANSDAILEGSMPFASSTASRRSGIPNAGGATTQTSARTRAPWAK